MLLGCYVPAIRISFSIPLAEKVFIKHDEISIDTLTIDLLKKYIWEKECYSGRAVPNVSSLKENEKRLKLCEDTYLKGKVPFSINNPDPDAFYLESLWL